MSAADLVKRHAAATIWRLTGRCARNRRELANARSGLRIVTFHETPPALFSRFQRIVDWGASHFPMARPDLADALFEGRAAELTGDHLLITLDDGCSSNYAAARWLADQGIAAFFFVVPSFLGRSIAEFTSYHHERGVEAYAPGMMGTDDRGLEPSQVLEMQAMGHRIGAHNFAHRDLGPLQSAEDLHYEIDQAIDAVSELSGRVCRDFAVGFGQPHNISDAAIEHLARRDSRVYLCFRGLNVPGISPRHLLRHGFCYEHPEAFTRICLEGGGDHSVVDRQVEMRRRVGLLPGPTSRE